MKEKETYLFREQWEEAREKLVNSIIKDLPPIECAGDFYRPREVERKFKANRLEAERDTRLKSWLCECPRPTLNRDQFIVQLANRVAALEAALAEKGGAE